MFTNINNNKYKKCTLDTIRVMKRHDTELRHGIEMLFMVIKDLLLQKCPYHCCHELLETKVHVSYVICCHSDDYPTANAYPSLENK